jgi:hypothetical protein
MCYCLHIASLNESQPYKIYSSRDSQNGLPGVRLGWPVTSTKEIVRCLCLMSQSCMCASLVSCLPERGIVTSLDPMATLQLLEPGHSWTSNTVLYSGKSSRRSRATRILKPTRSVLPPAHIHTVHSGSAPLPTYISNYILLKMLWRIALGHATGPSLIS